MWKTRLHPPIDNPTLRAAPRLVVAMLVVAALAVPTFGARATPPAAPTLIAELARLDQVLAAEPHSVEALLARARVHEELGRSMAAALDRLAALDLEPPGLDGVARLAAYNLDAAGAPAAAAALLARHPDAATGEAGAALVRFLEGNVAARHIRWGWAEPVFEPEGRHHEATTAIATLERHLAEDPTDQRSLWNLILALRLAERIDEVVALWEHHTADATSADATSPYWARNTVAYAYLATGRPSEALELYRSLLPERAAAPEPWLGIYWAALEQRDYGTAEDALDALAELPGHELDARIQRAWLRLYAGRTIAGYRLFDQLFSERPGDNRIREGRATASIWLGWPRRGERELAELLARTTQDSPPVDRPSPRIARAGALASVGELAAARNEARNLVARYPDHTHALRLARDIETQLSPELRLEARYDTSDRGLGETWTLLEVSAPLGTRARVAVGGHLSRSEDRPYALGDVEEAYLGLALRPHRALLLSGEAAWDVSSGDLDRDPAWTARLGWLPNDRWRLDLGWSDSGWRDLPLRARAAGIVADTVDLGVGYRSGLRWDFRIGGGRSELSDGNERTWALLATSWLARDGARYRASFGAEAYSSENTTNDVAYFSPLRDASFSLTHRSEWVLTNEPSRRHTFSILAHIGSYDQRGFDIGPVGGIWLQSDWDFVGRTVVVVGAGARSQLYDGSREIDPRVWVTLRRRF